MSNCFLVEFGDGHGECLEPQIEYLRASGHKVHLFCIERQLAKIEGFDPEAERVSLTVLPSPKGLASLKIVFMSIWRERPDFVILNSTQGSRVLKLLFMPMPWKTRFVGTLHNLSKLQSSLGQKLIDCRISGYYVLADYLLPEFRKLTHKPLRSIMPLNKASQASPSSPRKPEGEIWLCVPGPVDYARRNYNSLLQMAAHPGFKDTKFVLLGSSRVLRGDEFVGKVKQMGVADRFITFDAFVEPGVFSSYVRQSDYLLPLIDSSIGLCEKYKKSSISGTFTIAESYGKTMLCDSWLADIKDFNYSCRFYSNLDELAVACHMPPPVVAHPDIEKGRVNYDSLLTLVSAKSK